MTCPPKQVTQDSLFNLAAFPWEELRRAATSESGSCVTKLQLGGFEIEPDLAVRARRYLPGGAITPGNSRPPANPHRVLPQGRSNAELDEFAAGDDIFKGSVADEHPVLRVLSARVRDLS